MGSKKVRKAPLTVLNAEGEAKAAAEAESEAKVASEAKSEAAKAVTAAQHTADETRPRPSSRPSRWLRPQERVQTPPRCRTTAARSAASSPAHLPAPYSPPPLSCALSQGRRHAAAREPPPVTSLRGQ